MEIADCKPAISYTCRNGFLFHHKVIGILFPLVMVDSNCFEEDVVGRLVPLNPYPMSFIHQPGR